MSVSLQRGLAGLACRLLQVCLPRSLQAWGWAVRGETAAIPDDTQALRFALGSLCGLLPRAAAAWLLAPFFALFDHSARCSGGSLAMTIATAIIDRPRRLGLLCAAGAVALGLVHMTMAGAPPRYLGMNIGAWLAGVTLLALLGPVLRAERPWPGTAILVMAGALLATGLAGASAEGAARWVRFGALSLQPSLILLPVMLVAFARSQGGLATAGLITAAAAMAIQPDRAMAGTLAVGLVILTILCPKRPVIAALGASIAGFALTCLRADTLPASPYVDQILYSSFTVHPVAGVAVLSGSALLLVPALVGWVRDPANRTTYAVFGSVWLAVIAAAALGNYPTPIVGYGGSAILGYALSLLGLPKLTGPKLTGPKLAGSPSGAGVSRPAEADEAPLNRPLLLGAA